MALFDPLKPAKKPKIGLYSIGLEAYWAQFEGLKERLTEYGKIIEDEISIEVEVFNFGMVDNEGRGRREGNGLMIIM